MITLSDIPSRSPASRALPIGILAAALLTAPWWLPAVGLYQYLGIEIAIWIIFAMGFNLLFGYAGLHSFGHGAYLGIGAYAFGLFQQHVAISLWGGLAAAIAAAALAGAIVGAFVSHRRGIYYALLTIGFGQIFWFTSMKLHSVTGGEDGLLGIPRPPLGFFGVEADLNQNIALFYLAAAFVLVSVFILWRLANSPFGRVLQAIRQNETRARFAGYDVWRFKWAAFVISAVFAGLAGGLFSMAQQSAYPDVMSLHQSGLIVMMVLVGGGLVSFWGPVLGVLIYFIARDVLGGLTETWLLWYGLMFVVMVMIRPEGLAGMFHLAGRRVRGARANPEYAAEKV
ncbi:branched-chain amino acid ABC transporter permease [Nitratireductor mangrovi]|uniref:Branched-chain amino acid ABC transporter permease n=1 Tax=Nitratireductor mangrovi TaxID=2599600 RepID=A0A5B8KVX0_9HYPH|nr:branched-chain amino acid ABC transporter permease [Nitratireductor mangrovi]QDY99712.1 branched-chain amino acid ABC transporter permease [Nitratireductor mangrovi]